MNETTLLYVMTAFVIVSAIALCIQAGMLAGLDLYNYQVAAGKDRSSDTQSGESPAEG